MNSSGTPFTRELRLDAWSMGGSAPTVVEGHTVGRSPGERSCNKPDHCLYLYCYVVIVRQRVVKRRRVRGSWAP